jgi:hypothetical protein
LRKAPGKPVRVGLGGGWRVELREAAGDSGSSAISQPASLDLACESYATASVGKVAPVEDHHHIRVAALVLDELAEQFGLERHKNNTVDHYQRVSRAMRNRP